MPDSDHDASILNRIEAAGVPAPRVVLRDLAEEDSVDPAHEEGRRSRYLTIGKIAQGGVGQIHKCRDVDLGRSVAMKLLREEHVKDAGMVGRFVEEAQISGQLQHPGIVPVYELGLEQGGHPWFTMKLVRGESLAARLARRKDPRTHLRRFLAIFERICQTVAYVHSRGVIHRDLKPSNVMLGSYGEIQVVDWGFAKVLGQGGIVDERRAKMRDFDFSSIRTVRTADVGSDSMAGSIMGTPAYMPPEQALGHVEELDERSDVFSLGGILVEILTGSPPYVGEREDIMVMASQARLDDAYARLESCGVDEALVGLARRCLAPLRADRPDSAGEVAEAVSAWLARLVDEAHRSKIARIESRTNAERSRARADRIQAQADEQRRKRKHVLALASVVLATVLAGGGILLWVAAERAKRARSTAAAVAREERVVRLHEGREEWEAALSAARNTLEIAESGGAEERGRIEGLLARIEEGKRRHEEQAARIARDDALVRALEEILPPFGYEADAAQRGRAYAAAFEEYGIDVENGPPEAAALVLSGSHRAEDLAAALDAWGMLGLTGSDRYAEMAGRVFPDPIRERIWNARRNEEVWTLRRLAGSEEMHRQTAAVEALLGRALLATGQSREAIPYLTGALGRHPGDLRILLLLARAFEERQPPFRAQVRRYLVAALALRPKSLEVRHVLALATEASGLDAEQLWIDILRLRPDWSHAHMHLCRARIGSRDYEGAVEAGLCAAEADAGDPEGILALAEAEMLAGSLESAADRCRGISGASGATAARTLLLLGRALRPLGRGRRAREALSGAVEAAPDSPAGEAAAALLDRWQEDSDVYGRWSEVSRGDARPADAAEALSFARCCRAERREVSAAGYYRLAFRLDPALALLHATEAAQAAAAVGLGWGGGADLTEPERLAWRTQARLWAEDFFEEVRTASPEKPDRERVLAVYRLVTSRELNALLSLRRAGGEKLPEFEGTAWKQFHRQVVALLRNARLH